MEVPHHMHFLPSSLPPPSHPSYGELFLFAQHVRVLLLSSPLKFEEPQFSLAQIPRTPDFTCHTGSQDPTARCRLLIEKKGNNPPDLRKLPRVADAEMGDNRERAKDSRISQPSKQALVSALSLLQHRLKTGGKPPDKTGSEI